jgi:hypothetical protein
MRFKNDGELTVKYRVRAQCEDRGWAEAKVPRGSFPSIFPNDLIARIQQEELALLTEMAKKPTRQFHSKGNGSFYRLFLRAEIV